MPDFPFTDDLLQTYDLLQKDQAFNKDCVTQTRDTHIAAGAVTDLMAALELPELSGYIDELDGYTGPGGTFQELSDHLGWHFENLPTNLGMMSGYISDAAGLGRLPGFSPGMEAASGGSAARMLASTSPRAFAIAMMADTGSGSGGSTGGAAGGANKCSSMGDAFGSIMGKASEFLGKGLGMLGQITGMVQGIMSGGILGAVSKFANMAGLGNIPGIGQIGNIIGGINAISSGNIGALPGLLGQAGGLISNIGQMGNIQALGQMGNLIGGDLSKLTAIGTQIAGMAGVLGMTNNYGSIPNLGVASSTLGAVGTAVANLDGAPLVAAIAKVLPGLNAIINAPGTSGSTEPVSVSVAGLGDVRGLITSLTNLSAYVAVPGNAALLGDLTPLSAMAAMIAQNIQTVIVASGGTTTSTLVADLNALSAMINTYSHVTDLSAQIAAANSSVASMGGVTGFGNVQNILGTIQGITSKLGALGNITGALGNITGMLGGGLQGITGALGNLGNLAGSLGNLGGLGGMIGNLTGGLSKITGMIGALGSGNIGQMLGALGSLPGLGGMIGNLTGQLGGMMGQLGGLMGNISSMIGGEKGMLGAATKALGIIAGSFNLKQLFGNACAAGVLNNVGSNALNSAIGGGSGTNTNTSGVGAGSNDTPLPTAPTTSNTGFTTNPSAPYTAPQTRGPVYDPNAAGTAPNATPLPPTRPPELGGPPPTIGPTSFASPSFSQPYPQNARGKVWE